MCFEHSGPAAPAPQSRDPPAGPPRFIDPPGYCNLEPPCGWCRRIDGVLEWDCYCPDTPGPSPPHELGALACGYAGAPVHQPPRSRLRFRRRLRPRPRPLPLQRRRPRVVRPPRPAHAARARSRQLRCRTPVTLTAASQPRLTLEAHALGRSPTCCAFDGPSKATPEALALAIAELITHTADDAMPASRADETDVYVRTIHPAIVGLIAMLGGDHRGTSVVVVRAVLLRLAHSVALPTDASACKLMGIDRSAFGRWMGRVRDSAGGDTLAGVATNSCQESGARKRRAKAATQPPPQRARTSGAGASSAPPPDASPAEALAASACLLLAASAAPEADLGRGPQPASAPPSAPPSPPRCPSPSPLSEHELLAFLDGEPPQAAGPPSPAPSCILDAPLHAAPPREGATKWRDVRDQGAPYGGAQPACASWPAGPSPPPEPPPSIPPSPPEASEGGRRRSEDLRNIRRLRARLRRLGRGPPSPQAGYGWDSDPGIDTDGEDDPDAGFTLDDLVAAAGGDDPSDVHGLARDAGLTLDELIADAAGGALESPSATLRAMRAEALAASADGAVDPLAGSWHGAAAGRCPGRIPPGCAICGTDAEPMEAPSAVTRCWRVLRGVPMVFMCPLCGWRFTERDRRGLRVEHGPLPDAGPLVYRV